MKEELYWRKNGHYMPCDQDHIRKVMESIDVPLGKESFVRSVLESYEKTEKDLHSINTLEY
ncbi:MAG: hypothetical protein AB4062_11955 [Crocosphaera sp.]